MQRGLQLVEIAPQKNHFRPQEGPFQSLKRDNSGSIRAAIQSDPFNFLQESPVYFVEDLETFLDNRLRRVDSILRVQSCFVIFLETVSSRLENRACVGNIF